ncbi:MAG: hypothetical protein Kow0074_04390 [Candidatus Zixiibacteriota bacterium]
MRPVGAFIEDAPPPRKFSRHVRQLFVFLVVLVAITNLSPLILLDRLVRDEANRIHRQLKDALDQLELTWVRTPPDQRGAIDLDAIARAHAIRWLTVAVQDQDDGGSWLIQAATDSIPDYLQSSLGTATPNVPRSGYLDDSHYWEFRTHTEVWAGRNVIASAGIPAERLGEMRNQLHRERLVRGLVLAAFGLFALLFYRFVLLPFRDMRRRADALIRSGVIPGDLAAMHDDPEYVMSTFDVLVHKLLERADAFHRRAVHSERRARDLERFNELMLSSLSTGVLILNNHGLILQLNPSAEKILGVRADAVEGLIATDAGFPSEMVALIDEGLRFGYTYSRRELRIESEPGMRPRFLGVNTSLILDDRENLIGLSVLLSDITEIKHLKDALEENQRLADLGEMSAGLAHQLRNSTAAILGYGKLMIGKTPPGTAEHEWAQAIVDETRETEAMLTKFLDFARPLNSDQSLLSLNAVILESIQTLQHHAEENGVRVLCSLETDADDVQVIGDQLLLKQVLINLIQNAIEAMAEGGIVEISLQSRPGEHGRRGEALIRVSDTGTGINEDNLPRIFHPFHTTKDQGTGLGLPLAKKIAVLHGGNLILESTGSDGSVFVLSLPLAVPEPAPVITRPLSLKPPVS